MLELGKRHPIRIPGLALLCLVLALVTFIVTPDRLGQMISSVQSTVSHTRTPNIQYPANDEYGLRTMGATAGASAGYVNFGLSSGGAGYGAGATNPKDTREFLKTGYGATIKTRQVAELGEHLKTIIRGHFGRIDDFSLGSKNGSIAFIIPKNELEPFRNELKQLVWAKFLDEQTSAQNLLPQKQNIEADTAKTNYTITSLNSSLQTLIANHQKTIASLNTSRRTAANTLADVQRQLNEFPPNTSTLQTEQGTLTKQLGSLDYSIATENYNFSSRKQDLNAQISAGQSRLGSLQTQDQNLLDQVETVQGRITLEWISWFGIIDLYLPEHWLSIVFIGLAVFVYFSGAKRQAV